MSALGHKRTCAVQKGMSALPLKADIGALDLGGIWPSLSGVYVGVAGRVTA